MRQEFDAITGAGALVVVLPQKASSIQAYLEKNPAPCSLLPDTDRSRSRDWGVYHPLGLDAFRTARPASFVVDGNGKVSFSFVAPSQYRPAPLESVLEELRRAAGAGKP